MSVRVLSKVFMESQAKLSARLVLLVLADAASDDGIAWLNQDTIAAKAHITRQTVNECIDTLIGLGELERQKAQRGSKRINVYRCVMPGLAQPDYDRLPFTLEQPFAEDVGSSDVDDVGSSDVTMSGVPSPAVAHSVLVPLEPSEDPPRDRPGSIDRRPTTDIEYIQAKAILAIFNEVAGTRHGAKGWVAKIVMRLREHPELGVDQHEQIIRRVFETPWWRGAASPSVVYGSDVQFERSAHELLVEVDRKIGPAEAAEYGKTWGPGTGRDSPWEQLPSGTVIEGELLGETDAEA